MKGQLFVFSAPSGAGKTTLVRELTQINPNVVESVSHTTRPMREGEVDGVDYHFRSKDDFLADKENGIFVESFEVFGNHYGTSKSDLENIMAEGKHVALILDCQGAYEIKNIFKEDAHTIFIMPPSTQELENRLAHRGQDTPDVVAQRLKQAKSEMAQAENFDYTVLNKDLDKAVSKVLSIVDNHSKPSLTKELQPSSKSNTFRC